MAEWEYTFENQQDFEQRKTHEPHSEEHHMNFVCPLAETQSDIRAASYVISNVKW